MAATGKTGRWKDGVEGDGVMKGEGYKLPMFPVVNGFVLSALLIVVDVALVRSGNLIGGGIVTFLLTLGLLFIVRGENERVDDMTVPDWRDIGADEVENERNQELRDASLEIEWGQRDMALVETRLRQSAIFVVVLEGVALALLGWLWMEGGLKIYHWLLVVLVPYLGWSAFWGGVCVLGRSTGNVLDLSRSADEVLMPSHDVRGVSALLLIAALLYGVLGAGVLEYREHRRLLAAAG